MVDQFSIFYAQGNKRKSFYEKSKYNIFKKFYDTDVHDRDILTLSTESMQDEVAKKHIVADDTCLNKTTEQPPAMSFLESDDE